MKIHSVEQGVEKAKLSTNELSKLIVAASECKVTKSLTHLQIVFTGKIADLPSLKNSNTFARGNHFMPKGKVAHLKAMDYMVQQQIGWGDVPRFTERVSVIVSNRARTRSFDPNNTYQTVCDWLEPMTKTDGQHVKGKTRGWGLGVVPNDSLISGSSYHCWELGWSNNETVIIVAPFPQVASALRAYAEAHR